MFYSDEEVTKYIRDRLEVKRQACLNDIARLENETGRYYNYTEDYVKGMYKTLDKVRGNLTEIENKLANPTSEEDIEKARLKLIAIDEQNRLDRERSKAYLSDEKLIAELKRLLSEEESYTAKWQSWELIVGFLRHKGHTEVSEAYEEILASC